MIRHYTHEAGVRNLDREIANVCRKVARKVVAEGKNSAPKSPPNINEYLGIMKYRDFFAEKKNEIGLTTGLAWTEVGGQVLSTEATLMQGKGRLTLTGKLGDVMQESAQAGMSYVRSRSHLFGLPKDFYRHIDIHVHVPEGANPGRPVGRHHALHLHRQRVHGHPGPLRSRHDRRNHASW